MITPSFGLTATERVLPKLALDFTTAALDPRVTFTRAGNTATVVNSSGYVAAVAADTPRFDYDPVTLACKGLLIEEQRTNTSPNVDSWGFQRMSITSGVTSPENTANAFNYAATNVSGSHTIFRSVTLNQTSTNYCVSFFLRAAGYQYGYLQMFNGSNNVTTAFDLVGKTVTGSVGGLGVLVSTNIEQYSDGWCRVSLCGRAGVNASITFIILMANNSSYNVSFTGNNTDGFDVYGPQIEEGFFATSYIPTTTTALTRNADVARMTGTNFSDWFNASEGSFAVESDTSVTSGLRGILGTGSFGNSYYLTYSGTNVIYDVTAGGTTTANLIRTKSSQQCVTYKSNVARLASNGGATISDASVVLPTVTALNIGNFWGFAQYYLNGHMQKLYYYPQVFTAAETQAFSKQG